MRAPGDLARDTICGVDRSIEVLRSDRGGKIGDEAHAKRSAGSTRPRGRRRRNTHRLERARTARGWSNSTQADVLDRSTNGLRCRRRPGSRGRRPRSRRCSRPWRRAPRAGARSSRPWRRRGRAPSQRRRSTTYSAVAGMRAPPSNEDEAVTRPAPGACPSLPALRYATRRLRNEARRAASFASCVTHPARSSSASTRSSNFGSLRNMTSSAQLSR